MLKFIIVSLSVFSLIFLCLSNFGKTKAKILFFDLMSNTCDCIMYILSGGTTGLASNFTSLSKNIAFIKFKSNKAVIFFAIMRIVLLIIGYENILSLFFILFEVTDTWIIIKGTAQQLRVCLFLQQIIWVIYDAVMVSAYVAITTFIVLIFYFIGIVKYRNEVNDD